MLLVLLLGCGGGAPSTASDVPFDATRSGTSATSVQAALDELYVRCKAEPVAAAPVVAGTDAGLVARVQALELAVARLEGEGISSAERISYDPRETTLAGKTVQTAMTELEGRVEALEEKGIDRGAPGPALFELRDKHGNLVDTKGGGPQGPPNPQGGPQGPPNPGGPRPGK